MRLALQSKRQSLAESVTNVMIGYFIAVLSQVVVFPLVGVAASLSQNFTIGLYFTIISLVRSYLIRRYYDKKSKIIN